MWRGHHSRSRFGRHVDIIRRYEQLKGAAAEGADTQPEERDLAEEVRSELAFIGEQLREQLANSKASQPLRRQAIRRPCHWPNHQCSCRRRWLSWGLRWSRTVPASYRGRRTAASLSHGQRRAPPQ